MKSRSVVDLVCQEVVELVTEYLGQEMSPEDRVRMEQHLLACPPCTAHLAQVRATRALARELREDEPADAPGEGDLVAPFRRWSRSGSGEGPG